jgi:hypothetical protein
MVGQLVPVDLYHAQRTDQRIAASPTAAAQKTTSPATPKGCTRLTAAAAGGSASERPHLAVRDSVISVSVHWSGSVDTIARGVGRLTQVS